MPRGVAKSDLPTTTCPVCDRPFAWRRKWAKTWDAVRYCSDRCRRTARLPETKARRPATSRATPATGEDRRERRPTVGSAQRC